MTWRSVVVVGATAARLTRASALRCRTLAMVAASWVFAVGVMAAMAATLATVVRAATVARVATVVSWVCGANCSGVAAGAMARLLTTAAPRPIAALRPPAALRLAANRPS